MPRRGKYNARKVSADGYIFDSQAEYERYCELKLLQEAGAIHHLEVHPRYVLQEAFVDWSGSRQRAITYEADFSYQEADTNCYVIEDVKGVRTEVFKLKWKILMFQHSDWKFYIISARKR